MIGAANQYQDMQQGIQVLLLYFAMLMPWLRLTAAVPLYSGVLSFFASLCECGALYHDRPTQLIWTRLLWQKNACHQKQAYNRSVWVLFDRASWYVHCIPLAEL